MGIGEKLIEHLVVDTTAFIQNAPLQQVANNVYTIREVVDEIVNKSQLRRLCVLPYDLIIKDVFPENVQAVTEFSKKTGDYPSLSATDIKVMALTYQLEKEFLGVEHLRTAPVVARSISLSKPPAIETSTDLSGFYMPGKKHKKSDNSVSESSEDKDEQENIIDVDELKHKFENVNIETNLAEETSTDDVLKPVSDENDNESSADDSYESYEESDDEDSWITPSNIQEAKRHVNAELIEDKQVKVACITTDFAMQNVLKQMNLNVSALDGRMIRQLRTFILRCYACFSTTSIMTKQFCPKCGNNTLKKVAVSLDAEGKQVIHINARRPLTGRGKRFSLPTMKGGKYSNNPRLCEDQPMPDRKPTRVARTKTNLMSEDYVAGYSPFAMRDVNSKSAQMCIRPGEMKYWMRKNPNESRRHRKK